MMTAFLKGIVSQEVCKKIIISFCVDAEDIQNFDSPNYRKFSYEVYVCSLKLLSDSKILPETLKRDTDEETLTLKTSTEICNP
jgi:hypothetical protein